MMTDSWYSFKCLSTQAIPALAQGEIHIWLINHREAKDKIVELQAILSLEEKQRLSAFAKKTSQDVFVLSHGFLRLLSGAYLRLKPPELCFCYDPRGKPYLSDHPELHFSLSHCRAYTILAFGRGRCLGIDIEEIRSRPNLNLIWNYMTGSQWEWQGMVDNNKLTDFYQSWTRQEAFVKACGIGLAELEPSLALRIACKHLRRLHYAGQIWTLRNIKIDLTHAAAICFKGASGAIRFLQIGL